MIDEATLRVRDAKGNWVPERRPDSGPLAIHWIVPAHPLHSCSKGSS